MSDESMSDYYRSGDDDEPPEEPPAPFPFDWQADYFDWCEGQGWRCERAGRNNIRPHEHWLGPPQVEIVVYYREGAPRNGETALKAYIYTDDPRKLSAVIRQLLHTRDLMARMAEQS